MSDVQRYEAYISGVCESGCGESMNDNGEYVKYDDHIAIVDKKDFVIRSMQTRIDKLEKAMYQAVYNSKAIKAEGIREMLELKHRLSETHEDEVGVEWLPIYEINAYADNLEKGDE